MLEVTPYIRFVCEGGETEPNYFNGWLAAKGFKIPNAAYKPKNHSPIGIAKEAIARWKEAKSLRIPEEKVFVYAVFDRDGHDGIPDAFEMLRNTPVKVLFSNVCFEFWVLLHFEKSNRAFENCDSIVAWIRRNHDPDYAKSRDHYNRLKDRIPTAISNAKWLVEKHWRYEESRAWEKNPCTYVYEVMEETFKR